MDDSDLLRYARHILLNEIGLEGQQRIGSARVLMVGAGGLGCAAGLYLGASGIGELTLVDHDRVDLTNLQRQIAHTQARIGQPKVDSLQQAIHDLNPAVRLLAMPERADAALLAQLLPTVDLVLDCCDNFATRHAINAACVQHGKPLVSGAAIRFDAQVSVYDPRLKSSPCYACVFPAQQHYEETLCSTMGVFSPLVGIVGSMQAGEALKLLSGAGRSLTGRLLMIDGRNMEFTEMAVQRKPDCPVCGHRRA